MPPNNDMMKEILRLTQENNKMLHKMRRGAFMKTLLQIVFYVMLLVIPAYIYLQYMAPMVNQMMATVQQIQGTGVQAQAQFGSLQDALKNFADKFKVASSSN
jgi:flagellar biosynthesis/type III secretory pathway M-ring protein FliF/YscJ